MEKCNFHYSLDDDDGELLVTFFNGQTVSLKHGIAIRIPENKFDRISLDVQLPESQRKKQRLCSSVIRSDLRPRPARNVWEDDNRKLQLVGNFEASFYMQFPKGVLYMYEAACSLDAYCNSMHECIISWFAFRVC